MRLKRNVRFKINKFDPALEESDFSEISIIVFQKKHSKACQKLPYKYLKIKKNDR